MTSEQKHPESDYTEAEKTLGIYRVVRHYKGNRSPRTTRTGLTLMEAQRHCSNPKTSTEQWFDGYDLMKGDQGQELA